MKLTRRTAAALLGAGLLPVGPPADAQISKPRVPPGRHPGGWPVAFIGPGVDYTLDGIASRLARDGEGEIVGWDFVDSDRRPWQACTAFDCGTATAQTVLAEHGASNLVVIRATADRPQTLVDAVKLASRGPARIVLIAPEAADLPNGFRAEAASRHPTLLFVVPAAPRASTEQPPAMTPDYPNVIVVAASTAVPIGLPVPGADIAVPVFLHYPAGVPIYKASTDVAAARVAALTSRLQAPEPPADIHRR